MTAAPNPIEVDIATIARLCAGFAVDCQNDHVWACIPWGDVAATGYGSTPVRAIADAAHLLQAQEAAR